MSDHDVTTAGVAGEMSEYEREAGRLRHRRSGQVGPFFVSLPGWFLAALVYLGASAA